MTGRTAGSERRDPSPSQYDQIDLANHSSSSDEKEPWDEVRKPDSRVKKGTEPKRSTGSLFCINEFMGPTEQEDESLEDGDLPSLSRKTPMGGRVVNGQRTTKKPMSPPSKAGLVAPRSTEPKSQTSSFWGQLDIMDSLGSNVDTEEDLPDDERAAKLKQDRKNVEIAQRSRESEMYADEVETDPDDDYDEPNFCDYTLQSVADLCGTKSDDAQNNQALSQEVGHTTKRPTARDEFMDVEELTAIEVEYVDPKRGHSPRNVVLDASNEIDDDGAVADDEANGQSTSSWSPQRKNAYLAAMARKAREDFERKHQKTKPESSKKIDALTVSNDEDETDNVYNSFSATEKRKFLKHINSGMTPTESSALVLIDRGKLKTENDKERPLVDSKAGNKGTGDKKSPRFMFWKRGPKHIDDNDSKSDGKTANSLVANMTDFDVTPDEYEERFEEIDTPKRSGAVDRDVRFTEGVSDTPTHDARTKSSAEITMIQDPADAGEEFSVGGSSDSDANLSSDAGGYNLVKASMNETKQLSNDLVEDASVAQEEDNSKIAAALTTAIPTEAIVLASKPSSTTSIDPQAELPRSGNNFYDAVRIDRPEDNDADFVASIPKTQPKRVTRLASMRASPRAKGFSSMGENDKGVVVPNNNVETVDHVRPKAIVGIPVRRQRPTPETTISPQSDDGRRRIMGVPFPGAKIRGFTTLDDDGVAFKAEPDEFDTKSLGPIVNADPEHPEHPSKSQSDARNSEVCEDPINSNALAMASIPGDGLITPKKRDNVHSDTRQATSAGESSELQDLERTLLRPVAAVSDEDSADHDDDGYYLKTPKSMASSEANRNKVDITDMDSTSLGNYLESTSIYSGVQGQDHQSVVSGKSGWTAATGMTTSSSITQSSRKRRPGAAKERLAKAQKAQTLASTKNGWHESMRASASNFNTAWDPDSGFSDYLDTIAASVDFDVKSDEKLHVNLNITKPRKMRENKEAATVAFTPVEMNPRTPSVDLPFPSQWEKERSAMISNPGDSKDMKPGVVPVERPLVSEARDRAPSQLSPLQVDPSKPTGQLDTMKAAAAEIDLPFPSEWEKERSAMISNPDESKDAKLAVVPVERPLVSEARDRAPSQLSPLQVTPSKPTGWLDTMKAAAAEIGQDQGARWDPERGWIVSDENALQLQQLHSEKVPFADGNSGLVVPVTNDGILPRENDTERSETSINEQTMPRAVDVVPDSPHSQETGVEYKPAGGLIEANQTSITSKIENDTTPAVVRIESPPSHDDNADEVDSNDASAPSTVSMLLSGADLDLTKGGATTKETISGVPVGDQSPLNSWIQKSGTPQKSRSELSTEGSDQAVASTSEEKYVQLGDNGSVKSFSKDHSIVGTTPARKKMDPPAMGNVSQGPMIVSLMELEQVTTENCDNEDDTQPLLASAERLTQSSDERAPAVQVVKQKCDEEDITLFAPDIKAQLDGASSDGAHSASPRRKSGPVDLDDSVNLSDTDDDDDWEPDSFLQGQVSINLFANVGKTRLPEATVPKLNKPARDSSPIRERGLNVTRRIGTHVPDSDYRKPVDASGTIVANAKPVPLSPKGGGEKERNTDPVTRNDLNAFVETGSTLDIDTFPSVSSTNMNNMDKFAVASGPEKVTAQVIDSALETSPPVVVVTDTSKGKDEGQRIWRSPVLTSSTVVKPSPPASSGTPLTSSARSHQVLHTSPSNDSEASTPSAVSSMVKLRAKQWESMSGKSTTSSRKTRPSVVSPVLNPSVEPTPMSRDLSELTQQKTLAWAEGHDKVDRVASPTGSAAAYKTFLGKKVRAETAAAVKEEETKVRVTSDPVGSRTNNIREKRSNSYATQQRELDTDEDSLFEFKSASDIGVNFSTRDLPATRRVDQPASTRAGRGVSDGVFPDISPIQTQDEDDSVGEGNNLSKFETASDTGTNIEQSTFLQRLSACAAPMMPRQFIQNNDSVPMAHLAFLKTNPPVTRGTAPPSGVRSSGKFVPPTLCGRPDTILEHDSHETTSPQSSYSAKYRPTSAVKSSTVASDYKSSSSVASGEFGARTSYLDSLALRAAVSDPKRPGSRPRSRGKGRSGSSETSTSSKQSSEQWNEFLERKSQSGSATEVSKAAERFAAEKVEEMMEALSAKSSGRQGGNTQRVDAMLDKMAGADNRESLPLYDFTRAHSSDTRSSSRSKPRRKSESAKAAEELAAARVEAMMAAMTSSNLDEGEI